MNLNAGLDFGTTFSGFSWTRYKPLRDDVSQFNIGDVYTTVDYTDSKKTETHYPKTVTALYYKTPDSEPLWGWPALLEAGSCKDMQPWQYQTRFKLRLVGCDESNDANMPPLHPSHTAEKLIVDYLRCMKDFIIKTVSASAIINLAPTDLKWCLTVPAQWSPEARRATYQAAVKAGLVRDPNNPADNGGSPHPLVIVLEPEAASIFCFNKIANPAVAADL